MGNLVGNGSNLYRRANSLVRSPISVVLNPVEMAYYPLAGQWNSVGPTGGYPGWASVATVEQAMQNVRNGWKTPEENYGWRQVTTGHEPENIFYQGLWGISLPFEQGRGEAYMQLGAYRFVLPQTTMNLTGIRLRITHGGEICAYQNPNYSSAASNNFYGVNWNATTSRANTWRESFQGHGWDQPTWTQKVGCYKDMNAMLGKSCLSLYNAAQDTIDLNTGLTIGGTPTGNARIWTSTDFGYIPTAYTPYTQDYQLSDAIKNALLTNGGGWIVTLPPVEDDVPSFTSQLDFWWFCESHWGYRLLLDFE